MALSYLTSALGLLTMLSLVVAQEPVFNNLPGAIDINETASGDLIFAVDATDSDGDTLNFTIIGGNNDGNFEIDANGNLYVVPSPANLQADGGGATVQYVLDIQTNDGENYTTASIQVDVNEVNEVPAVANLPDSVTLQEDDLSNRVIQSTGADPAVDEEGDTLTYECTFSPSDDGSFYCDTSTGDIYTYTSPNYTASAYSIGVRIFDTNQYSAYAYLSVSIANVWGDVPFFNNLPNTTTLLEDAALGTIVYDIEVWDPDNQTYGDVTLSVSAVSPWDNTTFTLSGTTLNLTGLLDFETVSSYIITLEACDIDGCATETLTVTIENVDEPPTAYALAPMTIPENTVAPWVLVPGWNITDADGDVTFTYSLEPSTDSNYFDISSTDGNLTFVSTSALLDYEDAGRTDHTLTFNVLVADSTGQTSTVEVTVLIEDVNEFDPLIELDEYEVEITEGLTLDMLTFSTSDEDGGDVFGKVVKFKVGEPGSEYFRVVTNSDGSGTLETWKHVDLEAIGEDDLVFIVYAQDGGGREDATTVRVKIIDVNEFPPVMSKVLKFRINSNAAVGTLVGLAGATDEDLKDLVSYHQIDNSSVPFFIGYLDGQIIVNGELAPGTTYTFYAYAEDSGDPPLLSDVVEIQITTYDGEKVLVDWEIETDQYYYPSDIAQFEQNLKATCEPCTPVVASQHINENGNTVLKVYILKGNSTEDNPVYMSKKEMLRKYTTDGKKTPKDSAASLAPKGKVVSINEAYVTPPENWLLDTVPGNIVLALICIIAFGLISTLIAYLLDKYWWMNRAERRKYDTLS